MTTEERLERPKRRNRWMLSVVLIVFVSLYQQASARIGETPEQCQVRYGKPIKADKEKEELQFQKDEILITARFYKGKADYISFESKRKVSPRLLRGFPDSKIQELPTLLPGSGRTEYLQGFSDSEIQKLLKANSGGYSWIRRKDGSFAANEPKERIRNYGPVQWWTKDGTLLAIQLDVTKLLVVTKDHQRRFEEEEKAKENKKLQ